MPAHTVLQLAHGSVEIDEESVRYASCKGLHEVALRCDLVGCSVVAERGAWVVNAISYPTAPTHCGCCARGCVAQPTRRRRVRAFARLGDEPEAARVAALLSWAARASGILDGGAALPTAPPPRRRILAFLNPRSGPGTGLRLYAALCAPMLSDAGCDVDVIVTRRAREAESTLRDMPPAALLAYDGVLAGGGDGSLHEVIQGLLCRPDGARIAAALTVGHLPLGSGNGMSASLCAAAGMPYSVSNAALLVAKDQRSALDVASVFSRSSSSGGGGSRTWGTRCFSFLSTAWGLIADADIESEVLRCTGALRTDIWAALRVLTLRRYRGTLWVLPTYTGAAFAESGSGATASAAAVASPLADTHLALRPVYSGAVSLENAAATALERPEPQWPPRPELLRPFGEPLPKDAGWQALPGPFTLVWILSTTHQSIGVAAAPESAHDDGVLTVVTVGAGVGRVDVARLLLALDGAGFESFVREHPDIATVRRCRAFRIETDPTDPLRRYGHVAVDGEDAGYTDVQGELHPGLLRLFGPEGWRPV